MLNDPLQEELHNLFNEMPIPSSLLKEQGMLEPHLVGPASNLLRKSAPGDGLEIHHVLQKHTAGVGIHRYDPDAAPAIALPKVEHRRIRPE